MKEVVMKFLLKRLICGILMMMSCICGARTMIDIIVSDSLPQNNSPYSTVSKSWNRTCEECVSVAAIFDQKSQVYYEDEKIPIARMPLSGITNEWWWASSVSQNGSQYRSMREHRYILKEEFTSGWNLVEECASTDGWKKVFVVSNVVHNIDKLTRNGGPISMLTSTHIRCWKISILQDNGYPENPSWLCLDCYLCALTSANEPLEDERGTTIRIDHVDMYGQNGSMSELKTSSIQSSNAFVQVDAIYDPMSFYYDGEIPKEHIDCTDFKSDSPYFDAYGREGHHLIEQERFQSGWVLLDSGESQDGWFRTYMVSNFEHTCDILQTEQWTSKLDSVRVRTWRITITRPDMMPQDPDWLYGVVIPGQASTTVPESWEEEYPGFISKFGSDFSKAILMETGKKDGAGNPMFVWHDYVAGTDPTDETDVFTASITIVDGKVQVSYSPELDDARKALRKYTTWGKKSLMDTAWTDVERGCEAEYNFFKVTVEMR